MLQISEQLLLAECRKLIARHERYLRGMRQDDVRRRRREVTPRAATLLRPSYWSVDSGFNPYKVRSNVSSITRAVNLALRNGDYRPHPAVVHLIPKGEGETRPLSVFQIADAVVSRVAYSALLAKNSALMSARSYAYRSDLSTHDAIQYISSEFDTSERIFIAEYDFSKYFASIAHSHVFKSLVEGRFLVSESERLVMESFLAAPQVDELAYSRLIPPSEADRGLPQGTSISLFMANVAAWRMDRELERLGVGFARYADDTLIWSRSYAQISEAVNVLMRSSVAMGASINARKSRGIRIFSSSGESTELPAAEEIEFVGYRFKRGGVGLRANVLDRMKRRIDYLVWSNLFQALAQGSFNPSRVLPRVDRDYQVLIMQIRRYLYGDMTENRLRELQRSEVKLMRFPGVLSYFPLVDDVAQLKAFDGWLASTLYMSLRKRGEQLKAMGVGPLPYPHGLSREELLRAVGCTTSGQEIDLRIPSTARFAAVMLASARAFGANRIGRGRGVEEYQYVDDSPV